MQNYKFWLSAGTFGLCLNLAGCGTAARDASKIDYYAINGTVSGLVGSGLVLHSDNGEDLSIADNGTFSF